MIRDSAVTVLWIPYFDETSKNQTNVTVMMCNCVLSDICKSITHINLTSDY